MNAIRSRRGFLAALSAGAAGAVACPIALAIPAPTAEDSFSGLSASLATGDDADLFKLLEDHRAAAAEERLLYEVYERFERRNGSAGREASKGKSPTFYGGGLKI